MAVSNKKRKWILRNYPALPIPELAQQVGLEEREVAAVLAEAGKDLAGYAGESRPQAPRQSAPVERWALLIVALFTGLIYLNSLQNDFHYDDIHSLKDNLDIRFLSNIPKFFKYPEMFSARPSVMMPRPLLLITFALNYAWTQYQPWSWLLVNYLFHIGNALLVYVSLCHLLGRRRAALLAALLFACHPVNTETVNYINCRSSLMADMFMILTIYFFFRAELENRIGFFYASLGALAAGLLTKEEAFMAPFLILALDWLYFSRHGRQPWGPRLLRRYLPLLGVLVLYLLYRRAVQGFTMTTVHYPPGIVWLNLKTQSRVLIHYLNLLLFPIHLNSSYENIDYPGWIKDYVIFAWLFLGGLALLAFSLRRKAPAVGFFVANFFLALAPTSSVIRLNAFLNEHRLYLPSLGFCILLALALEKLLDLKPRRQLSASVWRNLIASLAVLIFVCFAGLTVSRNFLWKTDMILWRDAARKSPMKAQVISDLGNAFYRRIQPTADPGQSRDLDRAEQLYKWSIRADQRYFKAYHNLGTVYYSRGVSAERREDPEAAKALYEKAVSYFENALKINGQNAETWNDLGSTLIKLKRLKEAEECYRQATSFDPQLYKAMINLGVVLFYQGRELAKENPEATFAMFDEAIRWLEKSLKVYDRDPLPWYYLGQLYLQIYNKPAQAVPYLKKALELDPGNEMYRKFFMQAQSLASQPPSSP